MPNFTGCGTAMVTPFNRDGSLDESTFRKLVERQISSGINFLVPCGTTGESPTLDHAEHLRVVELTIEVNQGRVPVLAGAGGYNTAHVISMIADLKKLGVDGILSVTPYYNKPTQDGVFAHYKAISDSTDLPIILYSVQPRTNVNIEPSTMERLAVLPNIIGVKEASGSLAQVASIKGRVPEDFLILSGDDSVTLPVISLGGHGIISVVSNEIPSEMTQLAQAALMGDYSTARAIQRRFLPLMEINFVEANPQPAKAAMEMMGLLEANLRLPLIPVKSENFARIRQVLVNCGLLASSPIENTTHALHGTVVA
ncbi:MAG: 4-hydroxy-tetrahydrodipicolinate synthase [Fimbriimonadaceae bacterium]